MSRHGRTATTLLVAMVLLCTLGTAGRAHAQQIPPQLRNVDVVENLGEKIPLDGLFTDSDGNPYELGKAFHHDKPVFLTLVYYRCPMLCGLVVSGLVKTLGKSGLVLGRDYEAVTVSISPTETPKDALTRKRGHLQNMGRTESDPDWAFLVGPKMSIDPLAKALGFQYSYDAATKQFAHAAVAMVISPEGKIARYLYPAENGLEFVPRDVKLAAVEAANGRVGTTLDRLILTCYQYDPAKRRYGPYALAFVRGGAILVLVALVSLLAFLWRQELKLKQRKHHREQQRRAPV